jgi:DNA-binding NarL/FixJ family response regulator
MNTDSRSRDARILLVDDHPIVRLGIRQMIAGEPGLSVASEAESVEQAVECIRRDPIDLAIVDLSLGHGTGLELVRRLHEIQPNVPVLVLSMHDEILFAERALRAGARGYIMKHEAISGLVHAIRRVLSGQIYTSDRVSQSLMERLGGREPSSPGDLGTLTDRELEVFELIGRGASTSQIAEQLQVSVKTIETYRSNIKTKLNLKDAADLIRCAATWAERL